MSANMHLNLRWFMLVVAIVVAACTVGPVADDVPPPTEIRISTPTDPLGVAWLADGRVIVDYFPGAEPSAARLGTLDIQAGTITELPRPADRGCQRQQALAPVGLADGRLGFVHHCQHSFVDHEFTFEAFAESTGEFEPLAALINVGPQSHPTTANPDLTSFVTHDGDQICFAIQRFDRDGPDPLRVTITDEGRSFGLDEPSGAGDGCRGGRAAWPAFSPDGRSLAFLASPKSVGHGGKSRLDQPWNLYVLELSVMEPRMLVRDIFAAQSVRWSPSGDRLAVAGSIGRREATWLVHADGTGLELASSVRMNSVAWSPEGDRLVGVSRRVERGEVVVRVHLQDLQPPSS